MDKRQSSMTAGFFDALKGAVLALVLYITGTLILARFWPQRFDVYVICLLSIFGGLLSVFVGVWIKNRAEFYNKLVEDLHSKADDVKVDRIKKDLQDQINKKPSYEDIKNIMASLTRIESNFETSLQQNTAGHEELYRLVNENFREQTNLIVDTLKKNVRH